MADRHDISFPTNFTTNGVKYKVVDILSKETQTKKLRIEGSNGFASLTSYFLYESLCVL
jgi:hypothetical protein